MRAIIILMTILTGAQLSRGSSVAQTRYEGAWCAEVSIGRGSTSRDCRFKTFEDCRPWVLAGNRGFCVQNPYWPGWYVPTAKSTARHERGLQ